MELIKKHDLRDPKLTEETLLYRDGGGLPSKREIDGLSWLYIYCFVVKREARE